MLKHFPRGEAFNVFSVETMTGLTATNAASPVSLQSASIETREPLAYLERNFEIDGVRLDALAGNYTVASIHAN